MLGQQERIGLGTSGTHVDVCFGIILSWKFHVLPSAVESVKTKRKRNESANALRHGLRKRVHALPPFLKYVRDLVYRQEELEPDSRQRIFRTGKLSPNLPEREKPERRVTT